MDFKKRTFKNLIECIVDDVLLEASGREPNFFWLVTGISPRAPERLEQLANRKLHGVKGISDNRRIVIHFLGIGRNAVIVMPAAQTIQDNDRMDKIHYDDPDELLLNDMEYLSRIWNKEHKTDRGREGVMKNFSDYLVRVLKKSHDSTISRLGDRIRGGYTEIDRNVPEINSPEDLAEFVKNAALSSANESFRKELEKLPNSWWVRTINQVVVQAMKTYETEGEWALTGESFNIPKGSRLLVGVNKRPQDFPEEVRHQLKTGEFKGFRGITQGHIYSAPVIQAIYQYGLDKQYEVRFIDIEKFEKIQIELQMRGL